MAGGALTARAVAPRRRSRWGRLPGGTDAVAVRPCRRRLGVAM